MNGTLHMWLVTCIVTGCSAQRLRYSEIEMLGMRTCPHQDSCRLIRNGNFSERNCECDKNCAIYNDCCIDAAARRRATRSIPFCMPFGDSYLGAYVVTTCPEGSDAALVDLCVRDDYRDPILSSPVTDESSRLTYLNSYCAQCNDGSPNLQTWILGLDCIGLNDENVTWSDVSRTSEGWSVQDHPCQIRFDRPPGLRGGPRLCRANLIDSCTQRGRTYKRLCAGYLSMVLGRNDVAYRNPHCALCNGNKVKELSCYSGTTFTRGRKNFSFALLMDVNSSDGNRVGVKGPEVVCPGGQKYDPFFKKCRTLVCAIPGYTMSNGKCVKQ